MIFFVFLVVVRATIQKNYLWEKGYSSNDLSGLKVTGITEDSSGNIYLVGDDEEYKMVVVKLDRIGRIIFSIRFTVESPLGDFGGKSITYNEDLDRVSIIGSSEYDELCSFFQISETNPVYPGYYIFDSYSNCYKFEAWNNYLVFTGSTIRGGKKEMYYFVTNLDGVFVGIAYYYSKISSFPDHGRSMKVMNDSIHAVLVGDSTGDVTCGSLQNIGIYKIELGSGDLVWKKCFGSGSSDYVKDVCQLNDGQIVFVGNTRGFNPSSSMDGIAISLDPTTGDFNWGSGFGRKMNDTFSNGCSPTNDGGIIIVSYDEDEDSDGRENRKMTLTKFDNEGKLVWYISGANENTEGYAVRQSSYNGEILAGGGWNRTKTNRMLYMTRINDNTMEGCEGRFKDVLSGGEVDAMGWAAYPIGGGAVIDSSEILTKTSMLVGIRSDGDGDLVVIRDLLPMDNILELSACCTPNLGIGSECMDCAAGHTGGYQEGVYCVLVECDGIMSNDTERVCSGNGNCTEENVCVCESSFDASSYCGQCLPKWFGESCDTFSCLGLPANETGRVCSGMGVCESMDYCRCQQSGENELDYMYAGKECQFPICFGKASHHDSVCSKHGVCEDYDSCLCSEHYYGCECRESFRNPTFINSRRTEIEMEFFVSKEQFQISEKFEMDQEGEAFNCSLIIDNWVQFLKHDTSECEFSFVEISVGGIYLQVSKKLKIQIIDEDSYDDDDLNTLIPADLNITIRTVSIPEELVTLNVLSFNRGKEDDDKDKNKKDDGENNGADLSDYLGMIVGIPVSLVGIILCLIFSSLLFMIFLTCLFCIVFCFCFCGWGSCGSGVFVVGKKKLSKFQELDNFDLLLKEQQLEKDVATPRIKVQMELFEVDPKSLELISQIGDGGSEATIYKASWNGKIVAFKSFKIFDVCGNQRTFDEFEREATMMASVNHPCIIQFFGCCLKNPRVGYIMEFCEYGDLHMYIRKLKEKKDTFLFQEKMRMLIEIATGMSYLHSRRIVHRDLKLENVLINGSLSCKIMDFGISRIIETTKQQKTKGIGTSIYIAPEVVSGVMYNEKCDIFSFAIIMHILYFENFMPYGRGIDFIEAKVSTNPFFRPFTNGPVPEWYKNLMITCWDHEPQHRPKFVEIIEFLREHKDDEFYRRSNSRKKMGGSSGNLSRSLHALEQQQQRLSNRNYNDFNEEDGDPSIPKKRSFLFVYMKKSTQGPNRAERFFLMRRTMEALMKIVNDKYGEKETVKRLFVSDDKVLMTDEDVEDLEENELVNVEVYDERDQELVRLKQENEELERVLDDLMEKKKRKGFNKRQMYDEERVSLLSRGENEVVVESRKIPPPIPKKNRPTNRPKRSLLFQKKVKDNIDL